MNPARIAGMTLTLLLVSSCGGKRAPSDTGYAGTWMRGNERIRSTLAIVRVRDRWCVRIAVRSEDGKYVIRSGWDGHGVEVLEGARTRDLEWRSSVDGGTGRLRMWITETPADPSKKATHRVEELVIEPGGLEMSIYTVERDGTRYEDGLRPRRDYVKLSDDVTEPPAAEEAP